MSDGIQGVTNIDIKQVGNENNSVNEQSVIESLKASQEAQQVAFQATDDVEVAEEVVSAFVSSVVGTEQSSAKSELPDLVQAEPNDKAISKSEYYAANNKVQASEKVNSGEIANKETTVQVEAE